jgi:hypothetical protein
MSEHVFLQSGQIEVADINEVLDLAAVGWLEWGSDSRSLAFGSNVDYSMGNDVAVSKNLLEVRVGYTPSDALNYLRMKDANQELYYVEDGSDEELLSLAGRVLRVAQVAMTVYGGRLSGTIQDCGDCERPTGHISLYDAPYGIAGAKMAGSERIECVSCGETVRIELPARS